MGASYHVTIADSDFHPLTREARRLEVIANARDEISARGPAWSRRPVRIDDDVWIGIRAIILKGVHIGKRARVEAGAVVTHDVPAGAVVSRNPARIVDGPLCA